MSGFKLLWQLKEAERDERWPYYACQSQRRKRKSLLSNHLSGFDVTKDGRAQLKGHYCVSKSTPISHVTSNKWSSPSCTNLIYFMYDIFDCRDQDKEWSSCYCSAAVRGRGIISYYILSSCCVWWLFTVCFTANSDDHVYPCHPGAMFPNAQNVKSHELFCWSPSIPPL